MGKITQRLTSIIGYLLYALVVQVLLLWLLFPATGVRRWLEASLGTRTSLHWTIGDLRLVLPWRLSLADISAKRGNQTLAQVSSLAVGIDPLVIIAQDRSLISYWAALGGGEMRGGLSYNGAEQVRWNGQLSGLRLEQLQGLSQELGRSVTGVLACDFKFKGDPRRAIDGDLLLDWKITDGELEFKKPVLGLQKFDFKKISSQVTVKNRAIDITDGIVLSRLLGGSFTGAVYPVPQDILASGLKIQATFEPRSELLGGAESDSTIRMVRERLRDGKLFLTVSGSLRQPGILFQNNDGVDELDLQRKLGAP